MAGLVPAIHVLLAAKKKDVDARHKAGHDDDRCPPRTSNFAAPHHRPVNDAVICDSRAVAFRIVLS
jgi:hypothetical protein